MGAQPRNCPCEQESVRRRGHRDTELSVGSASVPLEGLAGLSQGWASGSHLPWAGFVCGDQRWECQGVWGEALGMHRQIQSHFPAEGAVDGGAPVLGEAVPGAEQDRLKQIFHFPAWLCQH